MLDYLTLFAEALEVRALLPVSCLLMKNLVGVQTDNPAVTAGFEAEIPERAGPTNAG